jgi:hypothetical protein
LTPRAIARRPVIGGSPNHTIEILHDDRLGGFVDALRAILCVIETFEAYGVGVAEIHGSARLTPRRVKP